MGSLAPLDTTIPLLHEVPRSARDDGRGKGIEIRRSEARFERASDLYFLKYGAAVIPNRASVAQRGRELVIWVQTSYNAQCMRSLPFATLRVGMTGEGDKHVRHEVDHNVLFP
jgi:hypothetical protein